MYYWLLSCLYGYEINVVTDAVIIVILQKQTETASIHKVKVEKSEENSKRNKDSIFKHDKNFIIKKGMEVILISPKTEQMAAKGTVQRAGDGECIEVMVNIVMRSRTMLHEAKGRITHMGHAQSRCIPWPRKNVSYLIALHCFSSCFNSCYLN